MVVHAIVVVQCFVKVHLSQSTMYQILQLSPLLMTEIDLYAQDCNLESLELVFSSIMDCQNLRN